MKKEVLGQGFSVEELFGGTILKKVIDIAKNGDFQSKAEPVKEGEEVIGEMTLLEKSIHNLLGKGEISKSEFSLAKEILTKLIYLRLNSKEDLVIRHGFKLVVDKDKCNCPVCQARRGESSFPFYPSGIIVIGMGLG